MPLWLASVLFLLVAAGIIVMLLVARRKGKKTWINLFIVIASIILFIILVYSLMTFLLLNSTSNQPSDVPLETSSTTSEASTTAPVTSPALVTVAPMPDEYDMPTEEVPVLYPDVLGIRNIKYEEMPTFGTQNEVTQFVLYNFLNNKFEFDFYIKKDLAIDEGTGGLHFK